MSQSPAIREHDDTQPSPMRLAVQEKLLTGADADKIAQAAALSVDGIEFNADGLTGRVDDISAVLTDAPVSAAAVRLSTDYHFLSPDEPTRQKALDALRYAMTDAVDIGADGVVLVPQPGPLTLPDLMPLKAPIELAVELMVMHLRSLSDLAYVFGIELYLHPLRPAESGFLNTLAQGVELRRRIKFHPHVWLAADTYHAADLTDDTRPSVRHLYLADTETGALPAAPADTDGVSGWAVVTRYDDDVPPAPDVLAAALEAVQE